MKVLFVHRQEGSTIGGAWRALLRMVPGVNRCGISTELLFTCEVQDLEGLSGVRCDLIPLPPARKGKSFPRYPSALGRLTGFLKERGPDVIHLNVLDDSIFFVLAARMAGGIPVVGHVRSIQTPDRFRKLWLPRLKRLVCVSEAVRSQAIAAGIPMDRVMVAHDPPDTRWKEWPAEEERNALRKKMEIPDRAPVIGTVGNISPVKGTDVLVRALPAVVSRFPEVRCVIVGGDDHGLQKEIAAAAEMAGVRKNLVFAGPMPDPRAAVSLMDVFVLPSREEGYGLVLLEAMSYAKPVVASRVGGVPDIVPGEDFGVLVPKEDPVALGGAISDLLADPQRRDRLGKAGAARAREEFGEGETEKLCRMYQELVKEGGG
jgi:glycosyltransferase involved in cell wall biosynthesis